MKKPSPIANSGTPLITKCSSSSFLRRLLKNARIFCCAGREGTYLINNESKQRIQYMMEGGSCHTSQTLLHDKQTQYVASCTFLKQRFFFISSLEL